MFPWKFVSLVAICTSTGAQALRAGDGDPAALAVTPEDTKTAVSWVALLDDNALDVRNNARSELSKMAWKALPALEAGCQAKGRKAEYYLALDNLIGSAKQARFDLAYPIFLADKEAKYKHDFLGWNELVEACGDNKDSRKLICGILGNKERVELFRNCTQQVGVSRKTISDYWYRIVKGKYEDTNAKWDAEETILDVGAGIIGELVVPGETPLEKGERFGIRQRGYIVPGICQDKRTMPYLSDNGLYGKSYRKLLVRWVETRTSYLGLWDADNVCRQLKLETAIRFKVNKLLLEHPQIEFPHRNVVFHNLALLDPKSTLPILKNFFEDTTSCKACDQKSEWQVRDGALAVTLACQGIDPKTYGFWYQMAGREPRGPKGQVLWDLRLQGDNYCFQGDDTGSTEDKRKAAFAKYEIWSKSNIARTEGK
jgi:hypothetical protein